MLDQMIGVGTFEARGGVLRDQRGRWTLNGSNAALTLLRYCWSVLSTDFIASLPIAVREGIAVYALCPCPGCPEVATELGLCRWHRALAGIYGRSLNDPQNDACLLCGTATEPEQGLERHGRVCADCDRKLQYAADFLRRQQYFRNDPALTGRRVIALAHHLGPSRPRS
jgi:hypothetical protein